MRQISAIFIFCLVLAAFGGGRAFGAAQQAPAPVPGDPAAQFVVNMASAYPSSHPLVRNVLRPWVESVLEQSGGRLVIRIFEPGTIAYSSSMGRSVRLGQSGLGMSLMSAEPESFRLCMLAVQAPGKACLKELSAAYWRMFTEVPELAAEFAGIKLLAVYATDPYQLCTVKNPPHTLEDIAGQRILADNPVSGGKLDDLGAASIVIPQTDFKMYLDDRLADGALLNLSNLSRLHIGGYINGVALGDLENGVVWLGMHQGLWDALPQELRTILTRSSGLALSQALGEAVSAGYRAAIGEMQNSNVQLHYFSAEERSRFYKNMQDLAQDGWQSLAEEKGFNARALQDRITRIMTESKVR